MSLQEKFREELKKAMKARDTERMGAIRILMGEFARQPEKSVADDQVIAIIKKLIKSERELLAHRREGVSSFLTIMEEYLPRQASEKEIKAWIDANVDFVILANKMQAMKPIMAHFGSSVDGGVVKKILQESY